MPTLADLVSRISFLAAMPAVVGISITAALLAISREWRLNVLALIIQYFCVALLLTRVVRVEVAAVKGLIGWMICTVFYLTERQVGEISWKTRDESLQPSPIQTHRWIMSSRASFSLLATLMVIVVASTAALRFPLPEVPSDISLACYLLAGLGLLRVGLGQQSPMAVGIGLLTFLSGFDLFFVALEPSLAVAGLLGAVSFLIALLVSFLHTTEANTANEGEGQ